MDSGRLRRRIVALAAAYALAIQGLLLAFVPATPDAASLAALCSHDGGAGGQGQPASHDPPCAALCTALDHSGVAGPAPPDAGLTVIRMAEAAAPPRDRPQPRRLRTGPQIPRAPPLA